MRPGAGMFTFLSLGVENLFNPELEEYTQVVGNDLLPPYICSPYRLLRHINNLETAETGYVDRDISSSLPNSCS